MFLVHEHPHSTYSVPETVLSASQELIHHSRLWGENYYHLHLQLGALRDQRAGKWQSQSSPLAVQLQRQALDHHAELPLRSLETWLLDSITFWFGLPRVGQCHLKVSSSQVPWSSLNYSSTDCRKRQGSWISGASTVDFQVGGGTHWERLFIANRGNSANKTLLSRTLAVTPGLPHLVAPRQSLFSTDWPGKSPDLPEPHFLLLKQGHLYLPDKDVYEA